MNLLARTVVSLRRWISPDSGFAVIVLGALVAVEVLGRQHAVSDLYDLFAVCCLTLIGATILIRHRRGRLAWVEPISRAGVAALVRLRAATFQIGLDMRGAPPVKRGVPPILRYAVGTLAILMMTCALASPALPLGLRTELVRVSYLAYLAVMALVWLAMFGVTLLLVFVPFAMIHDACVAARKGTKDENGRREFLITASYALAVFMFGMLLPLWIAPVICCTLYALHLIGVFMPRRFSVQILWRPYGTIQVRAMPWSQWVAYEFGLIGLTVVTLTLASTGALMWGDDAARIMMPVTSLLGVILAWLGPAFMTVLCVQMFIGRWRDPARPERRTLHVRDHDGSVSRRRIRRHFGHQGWDVSFANCGGKRADAAIELVAEVAPSIGEELEANVRWPLVLTADQLWRDGIMVRINRRAEIQYRRKFLKGLESLLKAAGQRVRGGCGYWLSPHFWFFPSLMRDSRPDEYDFDLAEDSILTPGVGPSYHAVFGRPVRRHMFEVLRAAQIDMIFIEDGVTFKRLRRVLRALFEVYDVHAGQRPAEEIDFRGLPGIRVLIHDYQFDEPFRASGYPEPKYELLGRARILHIFRDRGGQNEDVDAPFDLGRRPAPVGFPLL